MAKVKLEKVKYEYACPVCGKVVPKKDVEIEDNWVCLKCWDCFSFFRMPKEFFRVRKAKNLEDLY